MREAHGLGFLFEAKAIGVSRGGDARGSRPVIGHLCCLLDRGLAVRVSSRRDMLSNGWQGREACAGSLCVKSWATGILRSFV